MIVYICDNCGWMTPQPDGRSAWDAVQEHRTTVKRGLVVCGRCAP